MRSKLCMAMILAFACAMCLGLASAQEKTYVGSSQCKICHSKKETGEAYTKWKAEPHSKAVETLKNSESQEIAKKKGLAKPANEAPECLKCHATSAAAGAEKLAVDDGVQCESCHGPASVHVADGKKVMVAKDTSIDITKNMPKPDHAICVKCHNEESPTWKADRYTTKDGKKVGFDFDEAWKKIAHNNPTKKK